MPKNVPLIETDGAFGPASDPVNPATTQGGVSSNQLATVREDVKPPAATPPFLSGKPGEVLWLATRSVDFAVTTEEGGLLAVGQVAKGQVLRIDADGIFVGRTRIARVPGDQILKVFDRTTLGEHFETKLIRPLPPP